jgi:hypothetical protein
MQADEIMYSLNTCRYKKFEVIHIDLGVGSFIAINPGSENNKHIY